jgi:hypothetical protein
MSKAGAGPSQRTLNIPDALDSLSITVIQAD